MATAFSGSGPGKQTADGCSVELYRQLPYRGELDEVRALFAPGVDVLELGCGTGRMTRSLVDWGCSVTAVDNSPEMLAELPSAAVAVAADIEALDLRQTFQVVLLASTLVNHPDVETRTSFIRAIRRHVAPGSAVLVERHDPEWLCNAKVGPLGALNGISMSVQAASVQAALVSMTLRYEAAGGTWLQSFVAQALSENEIERLLESVGLGSFHWFGSGRRWVQALAQ